MVDQTVGGQAAYRFQLPVAIDKPRNPSKENRKPLSTTILSATYVIDVISSASVYHTLLSCPNISVEEGL